MAKSWSWSLLLNAAVADQEAVDVPTPDYDAAFADPASAQLAVDNDVVALPDKATVTFNGETATVVNLTGAEWPAGQTVYVYVAAKGLSGGEGGGDALVQIEANTAAIAVNAAAIADLETRVAALESAPASVDVTVITDFETRLSALEDAPARNHKKGR
jgi:hypothetical protein